MDYCVTRDQSSFVSRVIFYTNAFEKRDQQLLIETRLLSENYYDNSQ